MTPANEERSEDDCGIERDTIDKSSAPEKDVAIKRRTKTGCLNVVSNATRNVLNCVKSKRECAGYNPPFIYKQHNQSQSQHPTLILDSQWSEDQLDQRESPSQYYDLHQNYASSVLPRHYGPQRGSSNATQSQQESSDVARDMYERGENYAFALQTTTVSMDTSELQPTPYIRDQRLTHNARSSSSITHSIKDAPVSGSQYEDLDDPWDVDLDSARRESKQSQSMLHGPSGFDPVYEGAESSRENENAHRSRITRYLPYMSSPLMEERSQGIFKHYMTVTGLCMGTFERHDDLDSGSPRVVWTHGLPTMALNCPALAHAILAIGAMHMFKLNIGNESIAIKHFLYALRRVGRALGDPARRSEVTTLATVLLLGYYEVLSGDHSRWNLHLSGAGKLVMEHDYAGMMRTVKRMQSRAGFNVVRSWKQDLPSNEQAYGNLGIDGTRLLDDNDWKVNQELVSKLTGFEIDYDTQLQPQFQMGSVVPDFDPTPLGKWQVLTELYWWYCRQDIFASLLSGDPLLLPYAQWKFCPPRGPLNNSGKAHTTFDHLWLILARLADFGGRDRKRKQRVVNEMRGQQIPPPEFLAEPSSDRTTESGGLKCRDHTSDETRRRPSANEGRTRSSKSSAPPGPQLNFYGMMPPAARPVEMLPSYNAMKVELDAAHNPPPTSINSTEDDNLDSQTRHALEEHAAITEAFDLFESQLGPDYQSIASTHIQITTPFGPALQYKSHAIATLWTYFTMGRILLRRMHPHSPPAAMVSAGVNARVTHDDAQIIGRICGGLFAQHNYLLQAGHVDYVLSGAVMEVTFSLLFAAVQYQDHVQRGWTIGKLSEIAKVTGWHTSAAIAVACETMWEKAGSMGRGPPYQRTMDRNHADQRLNRDLKTGQSSSQFTSKMSPTEEHESRFVSHDRKLVDVHASTRTHWAMGLLAVEEDLRRMNLKDHE